MVGDRDARSASVGQRGGQLLPPYDKPLDEADDPPAAVVGEGGGHVAPVDVGLHRRLRRVGGTLDLDQRVTAGDEVGAVGQHVDRDRTPRGLSRPRRGSRDQQSNDETAHDVHHSPQPEQHRTGVIDLECPPVSSQFRKGRGPDLRVLSTRNRRLLRFRGYRGSAYSSVKRNSSATLRSKVARAWDGSPRCPAVVAPSQSIHSGWQRGLALRGRRRRTCRGRGRETRRGG